MVARPMIWIDREARERYLGEPQDTSRVLTPFEVDRLMKERGVIDVQGDLADYRERVLTIFEIVNLNILRDQAADRIEGKAPDRRFDASLVKFLHDAVPPFFSEAAPGEIPSAPGQAKHAGEHGEMQNPARDKPVRPGLAPVKLPRKRRRCRF